MNPLPLPGAHAGRQEDLSNAEGDSSSVFNPGDSVVPGAREGSPSPSVVIQAQVGYTVPMLSEVFVCGQLSF